MTDKNDQQIMVVKRELLFGKDYFQGFRLNTEIDYEERIIKNHEFIRRSDAEANPEFKQPIAYAIVVDPKFRDIFSYQRSPNDEDYAEKRLQGKWSLGLGGHIELKDLVHDESFSNEKINKYKNPIRASMLRELGEEIGIRHIVGINVLGYINDDSDSVGKVHFGILYVVPGDPNGLDVVDREISYGRFRSLRYLEEMMNSNNYDIENWSRIAFEPLVSYLRRNSL